jgi:chemotaxis protein MotB
MYRKERINLKLSVMKRLSNSLVFLLIILLGVSSCVSSRKYNKELAELERYRKEAKMYHSQMKKLKSDSINISEQADHLVRMLGMERKAKQIALNETEEYRILREKISLQGEQLEHLKKGILHALIDFETEDLQVHIEHGKVYVSMPNKLLFNVGGTQIGSTGKEALGHLSDVLKHHPDIQILVEGHTDNVPVRNGNPYFKDNWELSTSRATCVARILAKEDKLSPERVTVVGKAEFEPIADNSTLEGRQQNRRVEIVLSPRLEELMETIVFTDLKKDVMEYRHQIPSYNGIQNISNELKNEFDQKTIQMPAHKDAKNEIANILPQTMKNTYKDSKTVTNSNEFKVLIDIKNPNKDKKL